MQQDQMTELRYAVQYNCHVSDARHGTDYGLCSYLMKMREYYRWEKGLGYAEPLRKDEVGDWLLERERLWKELADTDFRPLSIEGSVYDPFDTGAVNRALNPQGLVYSGGLGQSAKPLFFLARLERREDPDGCAVLIAGEELARDLTSPPAMTRGSEIFVRRESLRRMIWEKLETWRWSKPENAMARAFAYYDFDNDLDTSLDGMTSDLLSLLLTHEKGEFSINLELGDDWNRMLADIAYTPAEMMARAVRDNLVDCRTTLPAVTTQGADVATHFLIGNLSNMRKEIFPGLLTAYTQWAATGDTGLLEAAAHAGSNHWSGLVSEMLALYRAEEVDVAKAIKILVESRPL